MNHIQMHSNNHLKQWSLFYTMCLKESYLTPPPLPVISEYIEKITRKWFLFSTIYREPYPPSQHIIMHNVNHKKHWSLFDVLCNVPERTLPPPPSITSEYIATITQNSDLSLQYVWKNHTATPPSNQIRIHSKITRNRDPCSLQCVWKSHTPPSHHSRYIETITRNIGNFSRLEFFAKMSFGRCVKYSLSSFTLFQGHSMKTYSRVYFLLCLFSAISGRSKLSEN